MSKIIGVKGNIVQIGTDSGKIINVNSSSLNFLPQIGDEIEVFRDGDKVIVAKKQPGSNGAVNVNVQQNIGAPVAYVQNKKAVNKVVYCLLAFFLGGIGIHKFYAGKIAAGILCLLFCWTFIPGIIAFIEFIIGLCKKSDANGKIWV